MEVRQLLADLRTHLREKIEPPVYVSDRRLVKAVGLMQVSMLNDVVNPKRLLNVLIAPFTHSPAHSAHMFDMSLEPATKSLHAAGIRVYHSCPPCCLVLCINKICQFSSGRGVCL